VEIDESGLPHPDGLSEDQAHRILARAVELDARNEELISFAQLRAVAAEAGISAEALEQAVQEVHAGHLHQTVRPLRQWRLVAQRLMRNRLLAVIIAVAAAAVLTPGDVVVQTALLALQIYGAYELSHALIGRRAKRDGPPNARDTLPHDPVRKADSHRRADGASRSLRLILA
jgi:hypothetical protein